MMARKVQRYDHRIRNMIVKSGNPNLFPKLQIPKSTVRDWFRKGPADVITVLELDLDQEDLLLKVQHLESQLAKAEVQATLITKTIKILGFELQYRRLPKAEVKEQILLALAEASKVVPLVTCLTWIGLSAARYYAWVKRSAQCMLEDLSSCPKLSPQRLTQKEVATIKEYVQSEEYAHFSILALCWFAKKAGSVFASPATWSKIVKKFKLRRPRVRVYPAKLRIGIRASAPGQIWHLDLSVIKLTDGTRCYIQGVLDNFSRYILAWQVTTDYGGLRTAALIERAIAKAKELGIEVIPNVIVDSGSENNNANVHQLVDAGRIVKTIAQIEIDESNSMIEALFLRAKHRYLYLKQLTSLEVLTGHADTYFHDSNNIIPHGALNGATPFEAITGKWTERVKEDLSQLARESRTLRIETNRALTCQACPC